MLQTPFSDVICGSEVKRVWVAIPPPLFSQLATKQCRVPSIQLTRTLFTKLKKNLIKKKRKDPWETNCLIKLIRLKSTMR